MVVLFKSYLSNIYNLGSISIDETIVNFIVDHSDEFCFIYGNYYHHGADLGSYAAIDARCCFMSNRNYISQELFKISNPTALGIF